MPFFSLEIREVNSVAAQRAVDKPLELLTPRQFLPGAFLLLILFLRGPSGRLPNRSCISRGSSGTMQLKRVNFFNVDYPYKKHFLSKEIVSIRNTASPNSFCNEIAWQEMVKDF